MTRAGCFKQVHGVGCKPRQRIRVAPRNAELPRAALHSLRLTPSLLRK